MKIKNSKILKCFIFILLTVGLIYSNIEPLYTPTAIPVNTSMFHFPNIIAHKAIVSGDFPGNSLESIQDTLNSSVDGIEVDVRTSKDGVLFLYHSNLLEEYTNGSGVPENYNWSELSKLVFKGSQHSHLVTLDDLFRIVGTQKVIFLDIKSSNFFEKELAKNVVELIQKYQLQENVFVESFNPIFLSLIRLASREIMIMYDFVDQSNALGEEDQLQFDQIPWVLKQHWIQKQIRRIVRPDILGPRFNLNKTILKELIQNNYPIIAWTVDDPELALNLYNIGINGVQSNTPLSIQTTIPQKFKTSYDAGGTKVMLDGILHIYTINDISKAFEKARKEKKKITIAGRKHSMGGHTLLNNSLQLDMLPFNKVVYNTYSKTVTIQSGATWKKVQDTLAKYRRSVKVMQSDNIFTVGGSISVNAHGWQVSSPPIASTIIAMTVMTPDGQLKKISKDSDPHLFSAIIGGYGMFAVIIDVELETTENYSVTFHSHFTSSEKLASSFKTYISANAKAQLAYARLSVDNNNLFDEAGLFWYEKHKTIHDKTSIEPEGLIALKRSIFRFSEYHDIGKKLRWKAEKLYAAKMNNHKPITRSDAMNTDIHILWPLYGKNKDILHEYFIPKEQLFNFITQLKANIIKYDVNTLNITIREVQKDNISSIPYAKQDVFGLVCLFSQSQDNKAEENMKSFTQDTISKAIDLNGNFYLPYRVFFNKNQLLKAYPNIKNWIELKKKYDPNIMLDSQFFEYIQNLLVD
jgi:FAD/FMN-containing dehydrogenase